ncbi:YicC/YloC family endoribonuclease [Metabacillus sediminilitoris]|uniref:YicC family protein n=1 Tax=Metabacillus sediminilitoris TaxID=2567941 RepID=A0A4S4C5F2_9BACI|nr:YicC/YloC family endoribonuclease [Metabacillus sediminilitoris]QGQ46911.1 YicC family protein [Metabacillus sediminilitoris]THF83059.1 YicC family protein [Metabacillus sediminilitoris]
MVVSMTGFGRASGQINSCFLTVELKSVNHRFLEISVKMPKQFMWLEDKIKKLISQYVSRGRIEVYVNIEGESLVDKSINIDWVLLTQFVDSLKQIKARFSLNDEISLDHILSLGEGLDIKEEPKSNVDIENVLLHTVKSALQKLTEMRKTEGEQLALDLKQRLVAMTNITVDLESTALSIIEQYREKLQKRVSEYVSGIIDENRILTEVALFADKADISEELTRIHSHIYQFGESLQANGPIGRKLDFIVQELNREVNTIGSKANDSQIAKNVVELKSIIEKLREQVQNIE